MRPLIGIPPCLDAGGRGVPGRVVQYADAAYARAVADAGGLPVYLGLGGSAGALAERLDGLLLPGGDDFLPATPYPPSVRFHPVSEHQLAFDLEVLAAALERRRPVLGICYGMQLLALHHGGRLHYDIATDVPGALGHIADRGDLRHALEVEPGSRLAEVLGDAGREVNSRHHQAVAEPGAGLRVCARSGDGLVEAVERTDLPFCIGVQWHPERMESPHRERLFRAFVGAC
jgi:putative glutamine amidotransferase